MLAKLLWTWRTLCPILDYLRLQLQWHWLHRRHLSRLWVHIQCVPSEWAQLQECSVGIQTLQCGVGIVYSFSINYPIGCYISNTKSCREKFKDIRYIFVEFMRLGQRKWSWMYIKVEERWCCKHIGGLWDKWHCLDSLSCTVATGN